MEISWAILLLVRLYKEESKALLALGAWGRRSRLYRWWHERSRSYEWFKKEGVREELLAAQFQIEKLHAAIGNFHMPGEVRRIFKGMEAAARERTRAQELLSLPQRSAITGDRLYRIIGEADERYAELLRQLLSTEVIERS